MNLYGDDKSQRSNLQIQYDRKINSVDRQDFNFDGKTLSWKGQVTGDAGPDTLTLNLEYGSKTLNLDQPSADKATLAKAEPNQLTLKLGDESYDFEAGLCSIKKYRTGNLMVFI